MDIIAKLVPPFINLRIKNLQLLSGKFRHKVINFYTQC